MALGTRLSAGTIAFAIVSLVATSCTVAVSYTMPGGAPTSASTPVDPTAEGFARLYQRECIDQLDLSWVQREMNSRLWWECQGDASSDCALNDTTSVLWTVPTTTHAMVGISISSPNEEPSVPASGLAGCEMYVSPDMVKPLLASVSRLTIAGRGLDGPIMNAEMDEHGNRLPPAIIWRTPKASRFHATVVFSRQEAASCSSATYMAKHPCGADEHHPWTLSYRPERDW